MGSEGEVVDICRKCSERAAAVSLHNVRRFVAGLDSRVPVVGGGTKPYVNLDNSATTPPFSTVTECLEQFFHWYSSVHRGTGFKSLLSTHVYERCREAVADFVGADTDYHALIFVQNATHALNKLAQRVCAGRGSLVISTVMEHHSNMLPWRRLGCDVEYAGVNPADGSLDLEDLEARIRRNRGRVSLVTVSGGSNVTGHIPPIRRIARLAHAYGAKMAVDATQLVPHRAFHMGDPDDPERIDFAAFSAHKMYAPFGCGVLIGPQHVFEVGPPEVVGGGTINAVTMDEVIWASSPERDEAGTPNVPGALALAAAIKTLESIGMDELAEHERALTRRALRKLAAIDGLTLYGSRDAELTEDRLGVVTFNAEGVEHAKLAAVLGYEWGVGVRNGCFCAQPYVRELLGVSEDEMRAIVAKLAAGDHTTVPGMVRMSLGVYNTADEVDYFVEALAAVLRDGPRGTYVQDPQHLDYVPEPPVFQIEQYAPI
jgi:cysteine desulfurase/selenocysteine lyase